MGKFDHFDFLAPYYERVIGQRDQESLISLVSPTSTGSLLDAGGGTGRIAQYFTGSGITVVVLDLSQKMLRQAAVKSGIAGVCSLTEAIPFEDESFARVIMVDALHHVIDHQRTLFEMWRVLQRGGRIVIEEPDIRHLGVKVIALVERLAFMRSHMIPSNTVREILEALGARCRVVCENFAYWVIAEKS